MIIGSNTPFENRAKKNLQVGVKYLSPQTRKKIPQQRESFLLNLGTKCNFDTY